MHPIGTNNSSSAFVVAIWKLPLEIQVKTDSRDEKMVAIAWLIEDEKKLEHALSFHRMWWGMLLGAANSANIWSGRFPHIGKANRSDIVCILSCDKENKIPTLPSIPVSNRGLRQFVRDKIIAYNRLQSSGKIKHLNVSGISLLSNAFEPLPELPNEFRPLDQITLCSQRQLDQLATSTKHKKSFNIKEI